MTDVLYLTELYYNEHPKIRKVVTKEIRFFEEMEERYILEENSILDEYVWKNSEDADFEDVVLNTPFHIYGYSIDVYGNSFELGVVTLNKNEGENILKTHLYDICQSRIDRLHEIQLEITRILE